jgi:hypothetical protein
MTALTHALFRRDSLTERRRKTSLCGVAFMRFAIRSLVKTVRSHTGFVNNVRKATVADSARGVSKTFLLIPKA